jgi:hypothetical protein
MARAYVHRISTVRRTAAEFFVAASLAMAASVVVSKVAHDLTVQRWPTWLEVTGGAAQLLMVVLIVRGCVRKAMLLALVFAWGSLGWHAIDGAPCHCLGFFDRLGRHMPTTWAAIQGLLAVAVLVLRDTGGTTGRERLPRSHPE